MLAKKISGRKSPRASVTPLDIKGHLVKANGNLTQVVVVWNVSDTGLCMWVTEKFKSGDLIACQLTHPVEISIACKIRWVRTVPERSGYLLGLEAVGDKTAMRTVFAGIHPETSTR